MRRRGKEEKKKKGCWSKGCGQTWLPAVCSNTATCTGKEHLIKHNLKPLVYDIFPKITQKLNQKQLNQLVSSQTCHLFCILHPAIAWFLCSIFINDMVGGETAKQKVVEGSPNMMQETKKWKVKNLRGEKEGRGGVAWCMYSSLQSARELPVQDVIEVLCLVVAWRNNTATEACGVIVSSRACGAQRTAAECCSRGLILNSAELGCITTRCTDTAMPHNKPVTRSSSLLLLLPCLLLFLLLPPASHLGIHCMRSPLVYSVQQSCCSAFEVPVFSVSIICPTWSRVSPGGGLGVVVAVVCQRKGRRKGGGWVVVNLPTPTAHRAVRTRPPPPWGYPSFSLEK